MVYFIGIFVTVTLCLKISHPLRSMVLLLLFILSIFNLDHTTSTKINLELIFGHFAFGIHLMQKVGIPPPREDGPPALRYGNHGCIITEFLDNAFLISACVAQLGKSTVAVLSRTFRSGSKDKYWSLANLRE